MLYRLRQAGYNSPGLLFSLGLLAARSGEWDRELELVQEGLKMASSQRDQGQLLRMESHAQLMLAQYDAALTAANRAIDLSNTMRDTLGLGASLMQLVQLYQLLEQEEQIEKTIRQTLSLYSGQGMPSRMTMLQNDLANLLIGQNRMSEALELIDAALQVAEKEKSVEQALLMETRGDVYLWCGECAQALPCYQAAFRACKHFKADVLAARVSVRLFEAALCTDGTDESATIQEVLKWLRRSSIINPALFFKALHFCEGLQDIHHQHWRAAHGHFVSILKRDSDRTSVSRERTHLLGACVACQLEEFGEADAEDLQQFLADRKAHRFHFSDLQRLTLVADVCTRFGWPNGALRPSDF